jgi:imipenem/basic amino acid-specific outer membrane pore
MKLVKMSLAAAVLLGASAFAIDNVKVSGDAKLFYTTNDNGTNNLLDKAGAAADTALRLGVTGDLAKGISFGVTGYAVSTLGLENSLVSNTWTGAHGAAAAGSTTAKGVSDQAWIGEAWMAATVGKTTAKLGRMELDTPLAFSEKWSVVPNTFDATVLINQDLPDTTLVGAWVGKGNGVNAVGGAEHALDVALGSGNGLTVPYGTVGGYNNAGPVGIDGIVGANGGFNTFASKGAYAAAAINNSFKPLVAQAWYYDVIEVANAYWLQADWDCQLVKGVKVGAQYANISPTGLTEKVLKSVALNHDSSAYAFKLAYGVNALKVSAAYSQTDKHGVLKIANVATDNIHAAQSKLYTESFWSYGYVGAADTKAYNLTAEYDAGVAKLGAYYTNADKAGGKTGDLQEVAVTATKSFGPLDTTLAYVNTKADTTGAYNTVQAYLTLNF